MAKKRTAKSSSTRSKSRVKSNSFLDRPQLNRFTVFAVMLISALVGSILVFTTFADQFGNKPPSASISGPTSGTVGKALTFDTQAFDYADENSDDLQAVEIYSSPKGQNIWNLVKNCAVNAENNSCRGSWTPLAAGSYDVVVNAYDKNGARCSGNPNVIYPYQGWVSCGSSSRLIVSVSGESNKAPVASIYSTNASYNTTAGQTMRFTANAQDSQPHLRQIDIYVSTKGQSNWVLLGSCRILDGEANSNCSANWTPSAPGLYDVVVNASDDAGARCSGNPNVTYPYDGWVSCGDESRRIVRVN